MGPHETKTISLDELSSAPSHDGGLHVRWNGNATDILVNGGLEDQAAGYSANIAFVAVIPPDQPMAVSQRISEVGPHDWRRTKGPQHALIAAAGSVDQSNTYVFAIAPSIVKESVAKSLSYWSTGNGDDTMITLWNPASEAQDFVGRPVQPANAY